MAVDIPAERHEPSPELRRALAWVVTALALQLLLWRIGPLIDPGAALARYLPLHTAMETLSIIVAALAFGIAWNAYAAARPGNVIIVGTFLAGTALLDFGHLLSYQGMPDFVTPSSPQKAIVFWLFARYLAGFGMVWAAFRSWQPLSTRWMRNGVAAGVLLAVVAVYLVALRAPAVFPDFYVPDAGLTPAKIALEYGLVALYLAAAWGFYRRARPGAGVPDEVARSCADLFAAMAIAALSELCFTLYAGVSDIFNIAGHVYKIACYGFIYRAVFVSSVRQPFAALARSLDRERHWAAEQHSFVRTLDMLEESVIGLDLAGALTSANSGWARQTGAAVGTPLLDCVHAADRGDLSLHLDELKAGRKNELHGRCRFRAQNDGDPPWMEFRFLLERGDDGAPLAIRGVLRDITKTYLQEARIAHMAMHDALTGLPNRVLLEDRLQKAIEFAARDRSLVAVGFIDLDNFKHVNDAYGHKTGDALLQDLATRLAGGLRASDTLARWGGDEFVVLLPGLKDIDEVREIGRRLLAIVQHAVSLDGLLVSATFSMGLAIFPHDGEDVEALFTHADRAMFYAKSSGRNTFRLFADTEIKGLGKRELYIQARLAQAIRDGRIEVWYQPLFGVDRDGRQSPLGFEALARWHDEEMGWISPGSFIPMAENQGLIGDLGRIVQRRALDQFRRWRQRLPVLYLSLNISKRQLFAPDFVDGLLADVREHGIDPAAITLEVTESVALAEVHFAADRLRELATHGFVLSIDDFGTGYASLSQLHELPVREIKIDISFVRRVAAPEGRRMLQAIVNLAKALRLRTVAEGVEDAASADILAELGVDVLQGYALCRPAPAAQLEDMPFLAGAAAADEHG